MVLKYLEGITGGGAVQSTNNSNDFWVVYGLNCGGLTPPNGSTGNLTVTVVNAQGRVVDEMVSFVFQATAVGELGLFIAMPKKLLVPPGGSVQATNVVAFQVIAGQLDELKGIL